MSIPEKLRCYIISTAPAIPSKTATKRKTMPEVFEPYQFQLATCKCCGVPAGWWNYRASSVSSPPPWADEACGVGGWYVICLGCGLSAGGPTKQIAAHNWNAMQSTYSSLLPILHPLRTGTNPRPLSYFDSPPIPSP